jgi:hypothetical protein
MKSADNIRELIKGLCIRPDADADRIIHDAISLALEEWEQTRQTPITHNFGRMIMKSKIAKFAAAVVIIIAVTLSINLLDSSITTAYALEQTVQANNNIDSFHFEYYSSLQDHNKELKKEAWVEYDERGNIRNVRVNYSWPKQEVVQIWKDGKAQQWNKESNRITYIDDKDYSDKVLYFGQRFNPKGAVQYLYDRQANGEITIEIEEPSDRTKPITVTANYPPNTYLLGKDTSAMLEIFYVDQDTKLVTEVEVYKLEDGKYVESGIWRYLDYDKPFDEAIFNF